MNTKAHDILHNADLHATHWGQRIIEAEQVGHFGSADIHDAAQWPTCACGKTTANIKREDWKDGSYAPIDAKLLKLGTRFENHVRDNDFATAAQTLVDIEVRASEVAI